MIGMYREDSLSRSTELLGYDHMTMRHMFTVAIYSTQTNWANAKSFIHAASYWSVWPCGWVVTHRTHSTCCSLYYQTIPANFISVDHCSKTFISLYLAAYLFILLFDSPTITDTFDYPCCLDIWLFYFIFIISLFFCFYTCIGSLSLHLVNSCDCQLYLYYNLPTKLASVEFVHCLDGPRRKFYVERMITRLASSRSCSRTLALMGSRSVLWNMCTTWRRWDTRRISEVMARRAAAAACDMLPRCP